MTSMMMMMKVLKNSVPDETDYLNEENGSAGKCENFAQNAT